MKTTLIATFTAVTILGGALTAAVSSPVVGQSLMAIGGELEARSYGLTEKTVTAAGIAHRLYEGGDPGKPTLVLLHGYSADKDVWPRFASHLIQDFHILIPDMAGHGETGFQADWNYTIPAQAERIVALMDAMQVQQFHVAGNSMGGMISATLALHYPDRVLTATAIDPAGVRSPEPSNMDRMVAAGRNPFQVRNDDEFRRFYAMTMAKPPYLPDVVIKGMSKTYQDRREELAEIFRQFSGKDLLENRLTDIQPPLFLIWGDRDELLHVSAVDVWKAGVPRIETVVMPGIGHMPMVETPAETATLVKTFIQRQNAVPLIRSSTQP